MYWLHSHFAGVYQDGQAVPLYIRPKEDRKNPFDVIADDEDEVKALKRHDQDPQIIMISDYMEINNWEMKEKMEEWQSELLCINTPLLNGRGRVNCATSENLQKWTESNTTTDKGCVDRSLRPGSENITFDEELWYTCTPTDVEVPTYEFDYETGWGIIHFVNAASHWQYMISIDEHELNFFAADGSYVKPVKGDAFTIGIGERIGVAFRLHTPGEYVLRVSAHDEPQVSNLKIILTHLNMRRLSVNLVLLDMALMMMMILLNIATRIVKMTLECHQYLSVNLGSTMQVNQYQMMLE